MMTGERVGVGHDPRRGAAYVENWVKVLEDDPHEIHRAARDAQRMSDYLLDRARELDRDNPIEERQAELTPEVFSRPRATDQSHAQTTHGATPPNSSNGTPARAADGPTR